MIIIIIILSFCGIPSKIKICTIETLYTKKYSLHIDRYANDVIAHIYFA